ncbi:MAG: hypothetical protein CMJ64_03205 [Planctomycetaceae bacterium]|nr:hypothetical protein [Planctomycetaceae bacterium]
MSKEPGERYVSGGAMATAVREYLKHSREAVTKTVAPVADTLADVSVPAFAPPPVPTRAVNNLASLRRHRRRRTQRQPWLLWSLVGACGIVPLLIFLIVIANNQHTEPVAQSTRTTPVAEQLASENLTSEEDADDGLPEAMAPKTAESLPDRAADATITPQDPPAAPEGIPPKPPERLGDLPGRFSPDDRPRRPPMRTAAQIIQDFDGNGDGVLRAAEIPFDQRPHIMRADANKDGIVVEEELDVFLILFRPEPPR